MALNNCTIDSSSVVVTPSQALGSGVANQVLTITPNQGFRVAAADFTNNTGSLVSGPIQSITLSDSGVAYADGNNVLVTVDLKDTFNPGTSDHTATIDIDGNATRIKDIPKTISGVANVTLTNATSSPASSGVKGKIKLARVADTSKGWEYEVTNVVDGTGYWKLTVQNAVGGVSPLGTFPGGDDLLVTLFDQSGNAYSGFTNKTYDWSQVTTDSDPGQGIVKANNQIPQNATILYIDEEDKTGANLDAQFTILSNAIPQFAYSASGDTGEQKDLFTRTVTASNGNYFFDIDDIRVDVTTGDVSDYVIVKTPNGTGTSFTSCTINVDTIIPSENKTGDAISITAGAISVPVATNNITAYSIEGVSTFSEPWPLSVVKRNMIVYGDVGATFTIKIENTGADNTLGTSDDYCYNFTTGAFVSSSVDSGTLTIGSNGQYDTGLLVFPVILADDTYKFTITAVSPTTMNLTNQSNPFTIDRLGFKKIQVAGTTTRSTITNTVTYSDYNSSTITHTGSNSIFGPAEQENETNSESVFNFSLLIQDNEEFTFSTTNLATLTLNDTHYNESASTGASIIEGTTVATIDNSGTNKKLTIAGTAWNNNNFGTADHTITFNIDDFTEIPSGSGGPGSGGGNVLVINSTQYIDDTDGNNSIIYPQGVIQGVTGRTTGSTTITYTLAGIKISSPDLPTYVDSLGDVTITAEAVTGSQTTSKFNSATYTATVTSFNITGSNGSYNHEATYDVTVTVTSFSPAVALGDELRLKVIFVFANDFS